MTGTVERGLWLIDGYNVLRVSLAPEPAKPGSPVLWWTEERRRALADLASRLDEQAQEIVLVFDARHLEQPQIDTQGFHHRQDGRVRVVFAPSADAWIVSAVRERRADFENVLVVTADRALGNRARSRGAEIVSTGRFVERCGGQTTPPSRRVMD
jgi:predicted RNA-binding protein with PIN domain